MLKSCNIPVLKQLVICWLIFVSAHTSAQEPAVYNINKYNGLSSNHIYCTIVDRIGYLWLGTTDGVYQYNGYTLKKYDYKDGLPNIDVWNLYEDRQGRIWLRTIAQHIGYIKNNKFHRVYKKTDNPNLEIYPEALVETSDGKIAFVNNTTDKKNTFVFCIVENDTLKSKRKTNNNFFKSMPHILGDFLYYISDSTIYTFDLQKILNSNSSEYGLPTRITLADINVTTAVRTQSTHTFAEKYIVYYFRGSSKLCFVNVQTGKCTIHDLKNVLKSKYGNINLCFIYKQSFYCITDNHIVQFDTNLNIRTSYQLDKLLPGKALSGFNNTHFIASKMWGKVLASSNNGIYIKQDTNGDIIQVSDKLDGFTFVNNKNDTVGYWWNNKKTQLATVYKGAIQNIKNLPGVYGPRKIAQYDSTKEILLCTNNTYWLYPDKSLKSIVRNIDTAIATDGTSKINNPRSYSVFTQFNDVFVSDTKELYFLGVANMGCKKMILDTIDRRLYYSSYNDQRFKNILYNRSVNTIICYSTDKVFLYNPYSGFRLELNQLQLEQLGFKAIEKIAVDTKGNVFIKDYNSLKVFNYRNGTIKGLLKTYNLKQAKIEIINDKLIVAGNFGVLYAGLGPHGNIIVRKIFRNVKNTYYKYIHDVQFASNHILLKTDNGSFLYQFHNDSGTYIDNYRFISSSKDSLCVLSYNDTLTVAQNTSVINIDVIRPAGTGNLRIEYAINKYPYRHSENQVILPTLKPGSYNTVSLIASDDSWRSKPLLFNIYIQPEWWQTHTAQRVLVTISLLFLIGFVYLIIIITRRVANRNNEKRNQRRELELKSIYSQINPHFIFNSLSTAQYFVRKNKNKEAFEHINQFSDLLRAYIKSSRAKYISIAEEIDNLENYLQLQLTRFEEKFDYNIEVDKTVDPVKVKIPSLLLQPLVENALNHGIFHSETKGNLNISFKIDESNQDTLICTVEDNGIGRQKSKELRGRIIRKADSYGTILINELIDTFNKYEKIHIEIEYIDKQLPHTGTTVIIRIKNFTHAQ